MDLDYVTNCRYLIVFKVVFVNYPYLILISNSRPLYVEDLFVKDRNEIELEITDVLKERFEKRLNNMLIVSNSLFVGALAEYWYYELRDVRKESYIGMIGITGGIIKMFQVVNHNSGTLLLILTRRAVENVE